MAKRKKHIEAKPTQYLNRLFRSKMEAKWAVALDNIPNVLKWEYEPTTLNFENGWTYTPDFYLTYFLDGQKVNSFLEVKPAKISTAYHYQLQKMSKQFMVPLLLICCPMFTKTANLPMWANCYMKHKTMVGIDPHECFQSLDTALGIALTYRFDLR